MEYEDGHTKLGFPKKRKRSKIKRPTKGGRSVSFAVAYGKRFGKTVKRSKNTLLARIAGINRRKLNKLVDKLLFYACVAGLCVMAWWGARGFIENWACWAFFYTALIMAVDRIIRLK